MKLLISVSAVQINIIIRYGKKFRHHGIGNAVCSCPLRISRENTVQILTIFIDHTHGTMFKSTDIDQRNDDHISLQFLRLKFFRKFHRRLYSYILGAVYSCCDQNRRSVFHPADHSRRHRHAASCDLNLTLCFFSFLDHPVINFDHWLFPFPFFLYFRTLFR